MDADKTLENVLEKSKSGGKILDVDKKKAVDALLRLCSGNNNPAIGVGYLLKLQYKLYQSLLEGFCDSAADEDVLRIATELVNNEEFNKKSNVNNIMYTKGLTAVTAFETKGKHQAAFLVLSRILSHFGDSNEFSAGFINSFKKRIIEQNKLYLIKELYKQVEIGNVACEEVEQKRLAGLLNVVEKSDTVIEKAKIPAAQQNDNPPPDVILKSVQHPKINLTENQEFIEFSNGMESLSKIAKTQQDILDAILRLREDQLNNETRDAALAQRDAELSAVRFEIAEKERHTAHLMSEIKTKDKQLAEMKRQSEDLTERLQASFHMDEITRNQDLNKLKNDISEALKIDYTDFITSKEKSYSEDLFGAYRSTLNRIFKILIKFGITCE